MSSWPTVLMPSTFFMFPDRDTYPLTQGLTRLPIIKMGRLLPEQAELIHFTDTLFKKYS